MSFIYGESDAPERARLQQHLDGCGECRAEVKQWRAAGKHLDAWKLPKQARVQTLLAPAVKWGLAACLVLGLGFAASQARASQQDLAELRDAMKAQQAEQEQTAREMRASIEAMRASAAESALAELRREISTAQERALAAATARTEQLMTDFARTVSAKRLADQEAITALLAEMESRRVEEMREFRKELETVAILTQASFQRAENQLVRLAAASGANVQNQSQE